MERILALKVLALLSVELASLGLGRSLEAGKSDAAIAKAKVHNPGLSTAIDLNGQ